MRKPRLTASMADKLLTLASYAESEATELYHGTKDQIELADDVCAAAEWITRLANWKRQQGEREERA